MGMEVFGRNPESEAGICFRASFWEWAPLYEAILALCGDLVDRATLEAMDYNEGAGPADRAVCREIAQRFEDWLARPDFEDCLVISLVQFSAIGALDDKLVHAILAERCELLAERRLRDLVLEWVGFVRHCGGFSVR